MELDQLIQNINKKTPLNTDEINLIKTVAYSRSLNRKEFILQPGMTCHSTMFVASGCLRSYYLIDGNIQILQLAIKDWWIGDLKSFLCQTPSTMYVQAIVESKVLQIRHSDLQTLYKSSSKFERFFRLLMEGALMAHQERILQLHSFSAKERYESFIQKFSSFQDIIPQKDIANYLGMTPEYLSSLRNIRSKSIS